MNEKSFKIHLLQHLEIHVIEIVQFYGKAPTRMHNEANSSSTRSPTKVHWNCTCKVVLIQGIKGDR